MKHKHYIEEVLNITFIEPQSLKPTEGFDPQRASELMLSIKNRNKWTTPIMVEKNHLVIMDGHHRHQVAQMLNLKMIPCILLSYDNPLLKLSSRINNLKVDS
ncbi:MAG: ParB N-terminal domain-containing protein [Burkholderiales bacterium]|nr:ParB N-terminal domain-containing protein [Burkholderiales bacterium]